MDQIGSKKINMNRFDCLGKTGSNWIKSDKIGPNWIKSDQVGSKWFKLVQIGSNCYKWVQIELNWISLDQDESD